MTAKKLAETKCQVALRRGAEDLPEIDDDDMVIVFKGAYAHLGIPTTRGELPKSDAKYLDTKMVASTPGQWTWLQVGSHIGQHPSGRKVGIQANLMLSTEIKPKAGAKAAKKSTSKASEMI